MLENSLCGRSGSGNQGGVLEKDGVRITKVRREESKARKRFTSNLVQVHIYLYISLSLSCKSIVINNILPFLT